MYINLWNIQQQETKPFWKTNTQTQGKNTNLQQSLHNLIQSIAIYFYSCSRAPRASRVDFLLPKEPERHCVKQLFPLQWKYVHHAARLTFECSSNAAPHISFIYEIRLIMMAAENISQAVFLPRRSLFLRECRHKSRKRERRDKLSVLLSKRQLVQLPQQSLLSFVW